MNYTARHIGEGKFKAILDNGDIKDLGSNTVGMIRYTYFEDFTLPSDNWEITREKLLEDYQQKVIRDVASGKIKTDPNQSDYIELKNIKD